MSVNRIVKVLLMASIGLGLVALADSGESSAPGGGDEQSYFMAQGFGRASPSMQEAQGRLSARRAAVLDAQRTLLEIVQGVTLYAATALGPAMEESEILESRVLGVLNGATVVSGSERWNPADGTFELTMALPREAFRGHLPQLQLAADGVTLLIGQVSRGAPGGTQSPTEGPAFAAQDDSFEVERGAITVLDVLANDNGDRSEFGLKVIVGVEHGMLIQEVGGLLTYTHAGDLNNHDRFVYALTDTHGNVSTGNVEIIFHPILEEDPKDDADVAEEAETDSETGDGSSTEAEPDPAVVEPQPVAENSDPPTEPADEPTDFPERETPSDPSQPAEPAEPSPPPEQPPVTDPTTPTPNPTPNPTPTLTTPAAPPPPVSTVASPPTGVGGPTVPIAGSMPVRVVLDASKFDFVQPLVLDISSTSGEVISENVWPVWRTSVGDALVDGAEVMEVVEITGGVAKVYIDDQAARRLKALLAERDFIMAGELWIAGGR